VPEDRPDAKGLEALIKKGEVDTVLTVFADGLGRLMGKRVVGRYFLDHVLHDGVHACIYLFTVDMEMEPLPGFKLASWERGYGDMKLVPDLTTWRLLPWLPKTALVFCDVYTEEGEPIEEAPRWVLRRQLERATRVGYRVKTASELELYLFKESFDEARAKRYHGLTPVSSYLEDYHILRLPGRAPSSRDPQDGSGAVPVSSQGEWGRGQEDQPALRRRVGDGRPARALQARVKEIAWQQGCSVTFMAKYDMGAAGSSFHLHSSVWDQAGRRNLFAAKDGGRQGTPLFQQWLAGQMAMAREFAYFYAPTVNGYTRYQAGSFAPTRIAAGWDNRTCGFRICGEGGGFRVENRDPGCRRQPVPGLRATIAAGLTASRRSSSPRRSTRGTLTRTRACPRCRRRSGTRSRSSRARGWRGRPSARRSWSTTSTRHGSSNRRSTRS
jgi:glutamine synthetase